MHRFRVGALVATQAPLALRHHLLVGLLLGCRGGCYPIALNGLVALGGKQMLVTQQP